MADPGPVAHSPAEWMAWVWGVVMGGVIAIASTLGWVTPKFRAIARKLEKVDKQISENDECAHRELDRDSKEIRAEVQKRTDEVNTRITNLATLVAALQENQALMRLTYAEVSNTLKELRAESRAQLNDLALMKGRMGIKDDK